MKVLSATPIEDCFDGSFIKEFKLSQPITLDFITKLGDGNSLEYFPDFPLPFFRIEKKNVYQIKGVESNYTLRIIFSRHCGSNCVKDLITLINNL
ncbi:hypothetical protein JXJ21_05000 [candidate division KSB1 bacterium]|nr:hypothetical protein [candidate division KSB1 bacterium]